MSATSTTSQAPAPTRPDRRGGATAPDPTDLARLLTLVWFEVQVGRRPFAQLAPLVAPALRRRLLSQLPRRRRPSGAPATRIRRIVTTSPSERAHEVCVLVEQGGRVTAIAVRLERHRGVWRAVELTAPEAGLAPLATPSEPLGPPRDAFDEVLEEFGEDL